MSTATDLAANPEYWPHRYDPQSDQIHFLHIPRSLHRQCTFVTDEHLPKDLSVQAFARSQVVTAQQDVAPAHFVFHSAYCCSTMLARAFDIEGISMGLKEPQILNDMIGWRRRGGQSGVVNRVTRDAMTLLRRPFLPGESIVVKPSNVVNPLASELLEMEPKSKALLLFSPLERYLRSIAKKNMWGRLWVRELLVGRLKDRTVIGGFSNEDLLSLTDLQVAAVGWLSEHALFAKLVERFGPERVTTVDSESLLASPRNSMLSVSRHFEIDLSESMLDEIIAGPAFNTNSKTGESFDASSRKKEQQDTAALHHEEIAMVVHWAKEVAKFAEVDLDLPGRLLDKVCPAN